MSSVEHDSVVPASSETAVAELHASADSRRIIDIPSIHPTRPCKVCRNFEPEQIARTITFSFGKLTESVAAACPTCSLVYQVIMNLEHAQCLRHIDWTWLTRHEDYVYRDRAKAVYDARKSKFPIKKNNITLLQSQRGSLSIVLEPYVPHPWLVHVFAEPGETYLWQVIKPDLSACRTLETAARWIEDHTKTATGPPSSLPTRIIEIDGSHRVRLKECAPDEKAHYACLSYCWGKNPERQLQTTKRTLAVFERELQWSLLPKTFQDALTLIRKLGLKYLWIDSLCILQDDPEDWRIEGSKMATIYANSYITIAATNSASPHDGLYSPVPEDDLYVVRTPEEHFKLRIRDGDKSAPYYDSMPLAKRAWAFQEHVLAPRVVHFAKDELFWEDAQMISCECHGLNENYPWNPSKGFYVKPHHIAEADAEERSLRWHSVVETYSGLQLTFESDIFPALQGIAHVMQQAKNCEYYAGLWEDNLIDDMLWFCLLPNVRPVAFRAPTWSWASVVGKVAYVPEYVQKCASVQSVTATPVGSSPLGQVCGASVTIRGPAFVAIISPLKIDDTENAYPSVSLTNGEALAISKTSRWYLDDLNGRNSGEMLMMLMTDYDEGEEAFTFVIFKSVGGGGGVYQRVGLWYTYDWVAKRLVFEDMEITVV